jgi:1-deoxy-D-xylulose-5-phosphate reductoisomerase
MNITVLGSTGSIGIQTLEVARSLGNSGRAAHGADGRVEHDSNGRAAFDSDGRAAFGINIIGLSAHRNAELLARQVRATGARYACIADERRYNDLKIALADTDTELLAGEEGLRELAAIPSDRVVNAVVGIAGLIPTEAAIRAGNPVALANKETLVAGGGFIMPLAKSHNVPIIPVDSEHSAIFQCLQGRPRNMQCQNDVQCQHDVQLQHDVQRRHDVQQQNNIQKDFSGKNRSDIAKIILTCSGGAFFGMTRAELEHITPEKIHNPNWVMGAKVTLDSATLANKGLEFIEAVRLFDVTAEQIEVVIHRESILHSAVEYKDGAVIAQLGAPDMRLPIQYALTYPERLPCPAKKLSLSDIGRLTFYKPDYSTFTALPAFMKAIEKGGAYPAYANAANEAAGALFLAGKIPFTRIGELIAETIETLPPAHADSIEQIQTADNIAREYVTSKIII